MVFQSYALYPHMTVFQNIAFGLKLARQRPGEVDRRVREAAGDAGHHRRFSTASRASSPAASASASPSAGPSCATRSVFLFDEPLSNLDASLRTQMRAEIARLQHRLGTTTVYVTHDQVEAMTLADRIVVLNEGRVEQVGAPLDLYARPATRFVAGFIGIPSMNFLEVAVDGDRCTLRDGQPAPDRRRGAARSRRRSASGPSIWRSARTACPPASSWSRSWARRTTCTWFWRPASA